MSTEQGDTQSKPERRCRKVGGERKRSVVRTGDSSSETSSFSKIHQPTKESYQNSQPSAHEYEELDCYDDDIMGKVAVAKMPLSSYRASERSHQAPFRTLREKGRVDKQIYTDIRDVARDRILPFPVARKLSRPQKQLSDSKPSFTASELTQEDYQCVLDLSTRSIACFEFIHSIPTTLSVEKTLSLVWNTPSVCVEGNQLFADEHGYTKPEDTFGKPLSFFLPPNDESFHVVKKLLNSDYFVLTVESKKPTSTGSSRIIEYSLRAVLQKGSIKKLWIVAGDVTEERNQVSALQEAEQHYRTLVERPGMVLIRIGTDGRYEYISPQMEDMLGLTIEELKSNQTLFREYLHPDDVDEYESLLHARWELNPHPVEVEYRLRHVDGTYHWYFERQTPKLSSTGEVEYFDAIALDIEESKRLESDLRQAQKMETIGVLAGGIAHDFNNHLTAMMGQINMTLKELGTDHPCYERILETEKAVIGCAEMTGQLLGFSRKSGSSPRPLAIDNLVNETVQLLKHVLPSSLSLTATVRDGVRPVLGNPAQLQQVIMNLAINARDAMPNGGSLVVKAKPFRIEAWKKSEVYPQAAPGEYVQVSVIDNGAGIPNELLPKVLDPFFTTKAPGKGTGLGLSMVYSIIQNHSGHLHIKSEEGVGTAIRFLLPVSSKPIKESSPVEKFRIIPGNETILIADDDELVRSMVVSALKKNGYSVVSAKDGIEALKAFETHRKSIDLILVDHTMPGKNGREVIERIRQYSENIPIIMTSGYGDALGENPDETLSFIGKPYSLPFLFTKIREKLGEEDSSSDK